ncbi:MAG: lantibiotic ABC transporter [Firmicutes bacterium GWF2_51_9]|nr:MAG: lantibiotic ABC transporter [Firmicutes bacterium GWF2_51_9]OGS58013.1 MAG: lantibiotic ABC transporter [Firmicutes bacterium GWE2_51_13]HAM64007.1 lantibiotic ABC transporter [Erysipelotrichaceae bacterium]HBZ42436.1 lantibiotic ABC transporter [Erysipelotrichaceae bacterium]
MNISIEQLRYATYFAPRGRIRLQNLGNQISQKYLQPNDKLIGVIGDAGSGKSLCIKGMFPGLELTNDDDGINVRPSPLMRDYQNANFKAHTYHIDVRFELAFTQMYELIDAVKAALKENCRVVVEHFDLVYPSIGKNGDILIGIGEEVIVVRPNLFGPEPEDVRNTVFKSLRYRRMAHSAEDLLVHILENEYHLVCDGHGDVKHGFILSFTKKPRISLAVLEKKVKQLIKKDLSITYLDPTHIKIGTDIVQYCTGPRTHVTHTAQIENFRLLDEYVYDEQRECYDMVGMVTEETIRDIHSINHFGE